MSGGSRCILCSLVLSFWYMQPFMFFMPSVAPVYIWVLITGTETSISTWKGSLESLRLSTITGSGILTSCIPKSSRLTHSTPSSRHTACIPADFNASMLSVPTMELSPTYSRPTCFSLKKRISPRTTSGWVQSPLAAGPLNPVFTFSRTDLLAAFSLNALLMASWAIAAGSVPFITYTCEIITAFPPNLSLSHALPCCMAGMFLYNLQNTRVLLALYFAAASMPFESSSTWSWISLGGAGVTRLTATSRTIAVTKATKVR